MKEKRYEAAYAGFVYEAPATHWTPSTVVRQRLTKMDFTKPDGIELGGMPIISDGQTAFVDAADGHTAVLACSGMKKSICGFMPLIVSLAQAGENLIVTDPKGELYDRTAGLLQHRGYQVYCLNFRSMDKDCFNILSYAAEVYRNGDQNKGLSLLSDIVNALAEEQRQRAKDNFWPDTAALWLNGTGAVMLDAFPDIKQVNVLNWSDFNVWSSAQIVEEHLLKKMPDNTAKAALRQCLSSPENTFRSILITASSFFGMFNQNPKLAAMLSHSTFTLGDLTNPKTALFLVTDDTTSTAEPILAMIISQIQSYLVDKAYHSKDGNPQVIGPVRFDEEKANSVQQEKTDKKKSAEVAEMVKSAAASTPETDLISALSLSARLAASGTAEDKQIVIRHSGVNTADSLPMISAVIASSFKYLSMFNLPCQVFEKYAFNR